MNNEKIAKIAREAARIYFNFNCTPEQAIETVCKSIENVEPKEGKRGEYVPEGRNFCFKLKGVKV